MFKYVLKRLGLSIIILLGVSIIIYFLVRLMPTDYLDVKFDAQIKQGTITEDRLIELKKTYGLYMPDAFLDITFEEGESEFAGMTFKKDAKQKDYESLESKILTYEEFYSGTYEGPNNLSLILDFNTSEFKIVDKSNPDNKNGEEKAIGTYSAGVGRVSLTVLSGPNVAGKVKYSVATVINKIGAILSGYFSWLGNMLRGDFGYSFIHQKPVGVVIAEHMWISFAISFVALILQFAIAIPLGIISATRQYSAVDYAVTVTTMVGISLPSFFFAALLVKVFSSWLGWFPVSGMVSGGASNVGISYMFDLLHHMVLPMVVLVVLSIGGLMRYTRTNMLEVLNSDYIRTARSKGLSEKKVIYVHAFRNTMIPLMTLLAGILPSLFGGAMITEEVFAIEGIGRLAYKALSGGDLPFIMGYNMFLAVLTVIGTLFSDLMYAVVDPRVKLSK